MIVIVNYRLLLKSIGNIIKIKNMMSMIVIRLSIITVAQNQPNHQWRNLTQTIATTMTTWRNNHHQTILYKLWMAFFLESFFLDTQVKQRSGPTKWTNEVDQEERKEASEARRTKKWSKKQHEMLWSKVSSKLFKKLY